ncbi:MFS transporter [Mobilicoccus pelagius]|uniref:Putative drug resistance transporter n=1 Tax=Mobilicoccus pelagius NBRC 104925 TaxID=1089455 RepID=H5UPN7_9MICO|nr:MFS transporter [Mobilicoccus pelagius]GAB47695.1 putative drug resistance transporter [Mobilicoccus pelagius NBRC 104925]
MSTARLGAGPNPKRAVPVILFLFVFSLIIDNGFKFASKSIGDDLGLSASTVSLQATLAGVIIGIGAVVYAALADAVSMRKLLVAAVGLISVGSLVGYAGRASFEWVLTGRIIQTTGLAAAETLYVIYVTKYLPREDQKTYLGFSTAAFQSSLLLGAIASGFIATYVHWTVFFLVPLLCLLALPGVLRTVPVHEATANHVDVFGLFLIATVATGIMLYLQAFDWWWLIPVLVALPLFVWHVRHNPRAIVDPSFFAEPRYPSMLAVVFVLYSAQLAYLFMFPFLVGDLYGLPESDASLLLAPGYLCAVLVGILSGRIARVLDSAAAITLAIGMIVVALVGPAIAPEAGTWIFVVSFTLFGSGFALLYAPLVSTAIRDIPPAKSGVAIGFYNLTINIAIPLGIAATAALMDAKPSFLSWATGATTEQGVRYANVLWIIALAAVLALLVYRVAHAALARRDAALGRTEDPAEIAPTA